MREESAGQELKLKEDDTKSEQEIVALRTTIHSSKVTYPGALHHCVAVSLTEASIRPRRCNTWLVSVRFRVL